MSGRDDHRQQEFGHIFGVQDQERAGPRSTIDSQNQQRERELDGSQLAAESSAPFIAPILSNVDPVEAKRTRRRCGCCPATKKGWIICALVTASVLITVAVLLYVYIPRFPQIKVYEIDLQNVANLSTPYSFTYKNPASPSLNELVLKMSLNMAVGTHNPNPYDLNVDSISLLAYMMVNTSVVYNPLATTPLTSYSALAQLVGPPNNGTPIPANYYASNASQIGTSSYGSIVFPSKATVNYSMIFDLNYSPDSTVGILNDPTALEMASACGVTARRNTTRLMTIHYDASSVIGALKPLGFTPTLSNDIHISCPFSLQQINAVVAKVQGGENVFDAIKEVFEGGNGAPPPPSSQIGVADRTTAAGDVVEPATTTSAARIPTAATTTALPTTAFESQDAGSGDTAFNTGKTKQTVSRFVSTVTTVASDNGGAQPTFPASTTVSETPFSSSELVPPVSDTASSVASTDASPVSLRPTRTQRGAATTDGESAPITSKL